MKSLEIIKTIWPLILIQVLFQLYGLYDLWKKKKTRNLTPLVWGIIILLGEIVGVALYFILGRSEE